MKFQANGTDLKNIYFNGTSLKKVYMNGTQVWQKASGEKVIIYNYSDPMYWLISGTTATNITKGVPVQCGFIGNGIVFCMSTTGASGTGYYSEYTEDGVTFTETYLGTQSYTIVSTGTLAIAMPSVTNLSYNNASVSVTYKISEDGIAWTNKTTSFSLPPYQQISGMTATKNFIILSTTYNDSSSTNIESAIYYTSNGVDWNSSSFSITNNYDYRRAHAYVSRCVYNDPNRVIISADTEGSSYSSFYTDYDYYQHYLFDLSSQTKYLLKESNNYFSSYLLLKSGDNVFIYFRDSSTWYYKKYSITSKSLSSITPTSLSSYNLDSVPFVSGGYLYLIPSSTSANDVFYCQFTDGDDIQTKTFQTFSYPTIFSDNRNNPASKYSDITKLYTFANNGNLFYIWNSFTDYTTTATGLSSYYYPRFWLNEATLS